MRAPSKPPSANIQHPSPKLASHPEKCCDCDDGSAFSLPVTEGRHAVRYEKTAATIIFMNTDGTKVITGSSAIFSTGGAMFESELDKGEGC
jgi:hypothetical protein